MTSRLTARERALVAAFGVLSAATSIAMLHDLQVVSFTPRETVIGDVVGLVLRLIVG
jgi:hypothetical protein